MDKLVDANNLSVTPTLNKNKQEMIDNTTKNYNKKTE